MPEPVSPKDYKRLKRLGGPGQARFLTFSCFHSRPFLRSGRAAGWFLESLARARVVHGFLLHAYVVIPTHVHLLMTPTESADISAVLKSIKQSVARKATLWTREHAPRALAGMMDSAGGVHFWQRGGGYDRVLVTAKAILNAIEYIHENPVHHGLDSHPRDWPWSSAPAYLDPKCPAEAPVPVDVWPTCIAVRPPEHAQAEP